MLKPHGFVSEAAGRDWAHWVSQADEKVVVRAHARTSHGGGVSLSMTGGLMSAEMQRDLVSAIEINGGS